MPAGMEGIRGAIADVRARQAGGGGGDGWLWFKVDDGGSEVVRFLEQGDEVHWAWVHEVKVEGRQAPDLRVCRDQDEKGNRIGEACKGCERDDRRKFQGWINVLWRNAPVFRRDKDGRLERDSSKRPIVEGRADQVAVWQQGIQVFEELDGKDVTYRGLSSRDFRISRRGSGLQTTYSIEPADPDAGPVALTDSDRKLVDGKYDLDPKVTPRAYNDYEGRSNNGAGEGTSAPSPDVSPFMRKRSEES